MQEDDKKGSLPKEQQEQTGHPQKGSSFNEEHKDIKQSDFVRSIEGSDPVGKEEDAMNQNKKAPQ